MNALENYLTDVYKVKHLPYDPVIALLEIYQKKKKKENIVKQTNKKDLYKNVLAAPFIIT